MFPGKRIHRHASIFLLFVLVIGFMTASAQTRAESSRLDSVISRFPAGSSTERDALAKELLGLGPEALLQVCRKLLPAGPRSDAQVRFALGAAAVYVTQKGLDEEKRNFSKLLLKALKERKNTEVKTFLISLLERTGGRESIKPLAACLREAGLRDPAARALVSIGLPGVEKVFIKALKRSDKPSLITLIKSLGELRSGEAVDHILPFAENRDAGIRGAARFALAGIGDVRAGAVLERTLVTASAYERLKAPADYLLFARRLGEGGKRGRALSICRTMIENYSGGPESQTACTALSLLFDLLDGEALDDLFGVMDSPSADLRGLALRLADRIPGEEATQQWMERAESLPPPVEAEIISMLGRRGDESALPLMKKALNSGEKILRLAALRAVPHMGGEGFMEELTSLLQQADEEESLLLKEAFLTMGASSLVSQLTSLFPKLNPFAKAAVVDVLGERGIREHRELAFELAGSEEEDLRRRGLSALANLSAAADIPRLIGMLTRNRDSADTLLIQDALISACNRIPDKSLRAEGLIEAMAEAEPGAKKDLIRILPRIGGTEALAKVRSLLEDKNSLIRTAAATALSQWGEADAAPALLMMAAEAENAKFSYLAVQGYVRLILQAGMTPAEKVDEMRKIRPLLSTPGEIKVFLAGLGGIKSTEALEGVLEYFDVAEQREDVVQNVLRIVMPEPEAEGLEGPAALSALDRIFGLIDNEFRREEVETYMEELLRKEGYVRLFNGWDLSGWMGDLGAYVPENNKIVIYPEKGSGNLYTVEQYSDFVFRFDFKLTPGANNGLGIRTPPQGDAAYEGMELQILDNTAEKYAELKPYQYHGSVYGIVPARRGFLRPVGMWNRQEVTVRGSRVTVRLNGVVITDADVEEAASGGTMDGREHPGLLRRNGHIGFLGHGSRVEFGNIYIKEL